MHPSVAQSMSRSTNMESKVNKSSRALLFGLSFNLILTLGSLGFTCYSLHRFDSRLTTVEQDLLVVNHPDHLSSSVILKPTSTHSPQSGPQRKKGVGKRAVNRPSQCRKCSSPCLNVNRHRNVSCFLYIKTILLMTHSLRSCFFLCVCGENLSYLLSLLNFSYIIFWNYNESERK